MINFIKYFLIVIFIHSFQTSFSQNASILTGKSIAFKDNDKVLLKSNAGYSDSTFIHKSSFKFDIPVSKGALYLVIFPNQHKVLIYPVFIKENSLIQIEMDSALLNPDIAGDSLALEQNNFWKSTISVSDKYKKIKNEIGQTNDSLEIIKLNKELGDEQIKINAFFIHWVKQHRSSPFSVAVIRLFIAKNNNKKDTLGKECFDYLLPIAKENNFETDL